MKKLETKTYILTRQMLTTKDKRDQLVPYFKAINENHKKTARKSAPPIRSQRERVREYRKIVNSQVTVFYEYKIYFKKYKTSRIFSFDALPGGSVYKTIKMHINQQLQYVRQSLSTIPIKRIQIKKDDFVFSKQGGLYITPGQFYEASVQRKVKELKIPKAPKTLNRHVGIELEFCAPMNETELMYIFWKAGVHKYGELKTDGSLRPKEGERAYELALIFPEGCYKKQLRHVCKILEKIGAKAENRRCGLHVHIDARKRKKDLVYNNLVACQEVLFNFLDPNRRNGEFCRSVVSRKFPTSFDGSRHERYKSINAAAFYRHKTIEIRMHEGSVDFKEIANWTDLLIRIANYPKKIKSDINELTILKKRIKLNNKMNEYFQDKVCFWQVKREDNAGTRIFDPPVAADPRAFVALTADTVTAEFTGTFNVAAFDLAETAPAAAEHRAYNINLTRRGGN